MKTKISLMIVTVAFVSQNALASLCPCISGAIAGAALLGLGGGFMALEQNARAEFLATHNSSQFNVSGYSSQNETCYTGVGGGFSGKSWTKHNFTGYANGQYWAYVAGKLFVQNVTKAASACGDSDKEALAAIKNGYPQSTPFVIWYEISNPDKFVFDSAFVHGNWVVPAIMSFIVGGIITVVAGVPLLYKCSKLVCKRLEYNQLEGSDVIMSKA